MVRNDKGERLKGTEEEDELGRKSLESRRRRRRRLWNRDSRVRAGQNPEGAEPERRGPIFRPNNTKWAALMFWGKAQQQR